MARNGAAKIVKAGIPNELYDSLSGDAQDTWDHIGSLGFRPDRDEKSNWFALSISGDDKLGPYESLEVLVGEVERHAAAKGSSDEIEIMEDHKGPRLPGIPLVADQAILTAAGKFKALNTEWGAKGKERKTAQDDLRAICHSKPHLFKKDPNNSNAKIYVAGGMIIRLKDEHKEKVEVELEDEVDV